MSDIFDALADLGMVERLDQRIVRQRAQERGGHEQGRAEGVRPLPLERPDQRGRGEGGGDRGGRGELIGAQGLLNLQRPAVEVALSPSSFER